MCFKPLKIRLSQKEMREKFPETFQPIHQGNYYPIKYRHIPCGSCLDCQTKYQRDWVFRLKQEEKASINANFLTLTYRDESLTQDNIYKDFLVLHKPHLQTFAKTVIRKQKRLLKSLKIENYPPLKYYACGEYGGKFYRPHYHLIMYNLHPVILSMLKSVSYEYKKTDTWKYGNIDVEDIGGKTHYVTKYLGKQHAPPETPKEKMPFNIMTPALGKSYLRPWIHRFHNKTENKNYSVPVQDYKIPMPDYYRKKFYNEHIRPILAEESIKSFKEHQKEQADKRGLTVEQYEKIRQEHKERLFTEKKRQFINKETQ